MTKADIVAQIAEKRGLGKAVVLDVVETFMECVKESMTGGENVYLRGFGSFVIKQRAEKVARNISKNTTVVIPAHSIPAFKSAQTFMQAVRRRMQNNRICGHRQKNEWSLPAAAAYLVDLLPLVSRAGASGPHSETEFLFR